MVRGSLALIAVLAVLVAGIDADDVVLPPLRDTTRNLELARRCGEEMNGARAKRESSSTIEPSRVDG